MCYVGDLSSLPDHLKKTNPRQIFFFLPLSH
jgi:hypothetical protein